MDYYTVQSIETLTDDGEVETQRRLEATKDFTVHGFEVKKGDIGGQVDEKSTVNRHINGDYGWVDYSSTVGGGAIIHGGYVGNKSILFGSQVTVSGQVLNSRINGKVFVDSDTKVTDTSIRGARPYDDQKMAMTNSTITGSNIVGDVTVYNSTVINTTMTDAEHVTLRSSLLDDCSVRGSVHLTELQAWGCKFHPVSKRQIVISGSRYIGLTIGTSISVVSVDGAKMYMHEGDPYIHGDKAQGRLKELTYQFLLDAQKVRDGMFGG